jgi:hypothetical protein
MGIQPQYFLDEMTWFELDAVLQQYYNQYKNQWEQTRLVAYYCAAPFAKLSMTDIIRFAWDKKESDIKPEELQQRKEVLLQALNSKNLREFNPLLSTG